MSEIMIRKSTKKDCPRLMELIRELAIYEKSPEQVTVSLEHFEESGFGQNPVWWAFVAESANGIIYGFALYYIRYSTWKGQRLYLEDIYIEPEMRNKNIGKMLFETLVQESKDRKLNGVVWQVLNWNEPALNFYRKYNSKFDREWINCSIDFGL